jgi:hypothetical protein
MMEDVRAIVVEKLVGLGWEALRAPAAAKIAYRTAVGNKEVLTYLADWGPSANWVLSGQYHSEGNNVLSASSVFIPKDATAEQVRALVEKFCRDVDKQVNQSYARSLWLRWGIGGIPSQTGTAQTIHGVLSPAT